MILQFSYSDIKKKSWIFSCLFSLKNKSFATKIHIQVQIAYLWTGQQGDVWGFWQIHVIFVLLKRNGPSLRTLAEQAKVKVVKLCFKKTKILSKQIPLLKVSLFSSILIQTTGEHRYSWAAAQGGETQGSSHKSGRWQAEIPGPSSSTSYQPRGWWSETQAPAATPAILVPRKTQTEPQ